MLFCVFVSILLTNYFAYFIPQIRELRNLFGDDTMFVALQSNEKFPDEGFDVDVQSKLKKSLISQKLINTL